MEELTREVEALDELLPPVSRCAACDAVLPECECPSGDADFDLEPAPRCGPDQAKKVKNEGASDGESQQTRNKKSANAIAHISCPPGT